MIDEMKMCNILKPTQSKSEVTAGFNILVKYLRGLCRECYKLLHISWLRSQKVLCSSLCMVAPFLVYNVHLDSNQNKGCRKAEKRLVLLQSFTVLSINWQPFRIPAQPSFLFMTKLHPPIPSKTTRQ